MTRQEGIECTKAKEKKLSSYRPNVYTVLIRLFFLWAQRLALGKQTVPSHPG
jgi:hypothetical protein